MNIPVSKLDTVTMMEMVNNPARMKPPMTYWLDLCFPLQINFDDEFIEFGDLPSSREIAPLATPLSKGLPGMVDAERVTRIKPAYSKQLDPISASRMVVKAAGLGEIAGQNSFSPAQRFVKKVETMLVTHRHNLTRLNEWMAAQAIIEGQVTLEGDEYPSTNVNFGRAASHDVTLTGAGAWGQAGVSIVDWIETWVAVVQNSKQGGVVNRMTVGTGAWNVMRKDAELLDYLDQKWRAPVTDGGFTMDRSIQTKVINGEEARLVGMLNNNIELWVFSSWYERDGATVQLMDPRDIVLTGTSVQGVRCFGVVQDIDANWESAEVWAKMYKEENPSAMNVLTQSAPLMVPISPDATFRGRVID